MIKNNIFYNKYPVISLSTTGSFFNINHLDRCSNGLSRVMLASLFPQALLMIHILTNNPLFCCFHLALGSFPYKFSFFLRKPPSLIKNMFCYCSGNGYLEFFTELHQLQLKGFTLTLKKASIKTIIFKTISEKNAI